MTWCHYTRDLQFRERELWSSLASSQSSRFGSCSGNDKHDLLCFHTQLHSSQSDSHSARSMAILHDVVNGVGKHLYYLGYCAQHSQYVLCTMYPLDCLDDSQVQNNQAYTCICIQKEGRLSKASGPCQIIHPQECKSFPCSSNLQPATTINSRLTANSSSPSFSMALSIVKSTVLDKPRG